MSLLFVLVLCLISFFHSLPQSSLGRHKRQANTCISTHTPQRGQNRDSKSCQYHMSLTTKICVRPFFLQRRHTYTLACMFGTTSPKILAPRTWHSAVGNLQPDLKYQTKLVYIHCENKGRMFLLKKVYLKQIINHQLPFNLLPTPQCAARVAF